MLKLNKSIRRKTKCKTKKQSTITYIDRLCKIVHLKESKSVWPPHYFGGFPQIMSECLYDVNNKKEKYNNLAVIGVQYIKKDVQIGITGTSSVSDVQEILQVTENFRFLKKNKQGESCYNYLNSTIHKDDPNLIKLLDITFLKETSEECGLLPINTNMITIDWDSSMKKNTRQCWGGYTTPIEHLGTNLGNFGIAKTDKSDCSNFKVASVVYGEYNELVTAVLETLKNNSNFMKESLGNDNIISICIIPIEIAMNQNKLNPYKPNWL
jgi:hypothetical protein